MVESLADLKFSCKTAQAPVRTRGTAIDRFYRGSEEGAILNGLLVRKILDTPPAGIATCAINVSNTLQGSPAFPYVRAGTFWPDDIYRDAGGFVPGMPIPSPYLPDPFK